MKKIDKIFLRIIIGEIILFVINYFISFGYSTPCVAPDFLHPFGKTLVPGHACAQVIHQAPSYLFYLMPYIITLTLIVYLILRLKKR